MSAELKLNLPEKKTMSGSSKLVILLLLVLLAIGITNLLVLIKHPKQLTGKGALLAADREKELALKFEKLQLYTSAITAWESYLQSSQLPAEQKANIYYRIAKLHRDAGEYEKAIASYYYSESLAELPAIATEIAQGVQVCLENLGKFAALRDDLKERVGLGGKESEEIVAEIGTSKITKADLDHKIEEQIEIQLAHYGAILPPDELKQQKEKLFQQLSNNEARQRFLNQFIAEELLYRKARESRLAEQPAVRAVLRDAERKLLTQKMIEAEFADQIKITQGDVRTYYDAHQRDYVQPERAQIRHIQVSDEKMVEEVKKRVLAGESFEELARQISSDEATKKQGGKIEGWIEKGAPIPNIGTAQEASAIIFATEPGNLAERALKSDKGFHLIQVVTREPERQKDFDEVKTEVYRSLRNIKEQEVQDKLFAGLREKYDVVIHFSKLGNQDTKKDKTTPSK